MSAIKDRQLPDVKPHSALCRHRAACLEEEEKPNDIALLRWRQLKILGGEAESTTKAQKHEGSGDG